MAKVIVIGGGPAGMLAAARAALRHDVMLLERNEKLGKKLYITGKGRCNLTNLVDNGDFLTKVTRNARFLYGTLERFGPGDLVELMESLGVRLKTERGNRVFPESDKSSDVIRALENYARSNGVDVRLGMRAAGIEAADGSVKAVCAQGVRYPADAVILCTGGCSYPATGSTGDGWDFLRAMGHTLLEPKPSLVPIRTSEAWPGELAGLTLKNVRLSAWYKEKRIFEELGELLFTHEGVSGPLALSLSSVIADNPEGVMMSVDLKPGLREELLDARLRRDLAENPRKQALSALHALMPGRLLPVVFALSECLEERRAGEMTKAERTKLARTVKALPMRVRSLGGFNEAVVTRGGVSIGEVEPKTMASRLVKGLYIAGELLDVDAMTGGFNLQIAFSTGFTAGENVLV